MNQNPVFGSGRRDGPAVPRAFPTQPRASSRIELVLVSLFVFLAPFSILRLDAFYFTASDVFAVATLLAMVLGRRLSFVTLGVGTVLWNVGLAALTSTLLLSSLLYGDEARGFVLSGQYLFAYLLLGYTLVARPWNEIVLLIKLFVLSIALMCVHGIYVIHLVAQTNTAFVSGSGRLLGFIERENECATVIALTVPLLLWLVASGCLRARWLLAALPLFAYGIALTGSNTGLLALVYAVAAFVLATGSLRQIVAVAGSAFGLFTVVVTWGRDFLPEIFQRRVLGALETGNIDEAGTFADRVQLIYEAIGRAEHAMILGVGADQYRVTSIFHAPVHNTYLLLWTEAGFFGLAGFVMMIVGALLTALAAFRVPGGRVAAVCTLTSVTLFALLVNALPHMYARFFVVPLLLAICPSVAVVRDGPLPAALARFAKGTRRVASGRARPFRPMAVTPPGARA